MTTILNCIFDGNQADAAPAIYAGNQATVNFSEFQNHTDLLGGTIPIVGVSNAVISNFQYNCWNGEEVPRGLLYIPFDTSCSPPIDSTPAANHNTVGVECPICATGEVVGSLPILFRTGEKTEQFTDIRLTTPVGALTLERSYRQSKNIANPVPATPEDGFTGVIGAGWTHNHDLRIFTHASYPNKLLLKMPSGGIAHFTQDAVITTQYNGDPGSNSVIDASGSGTSTYVMTTSDESVWVFDSAGKLQTRTWSNGEVWTYSYYSTGFAAGLLQSVADDYGRSLQFGYIDNVGNFDNLHLKTVGDHTVTDINNPTSGVFVQYEYSQNKKDDGFGMPIAGGQALLIAVTDVRGQVWTYSYETADIDTLNWIVQEDSPTVDSNGSGSPDGVLTLKQLSYTIEDDTITHISQKRGKHSSEANYLMQTDYAFQPNGANITTEETAGRITTHHFAGGVFAGTENPDGNLPVSGLDVSYRPAAQLDANGNGTQLEWSSDGKKLNSVTDAENHTTRFQYDSSDRLIQSTDAEGRITEYIYDDVTYPNLRQPAVIKVKDTNGITVLRHQKFTYDSKGRTTKEQLLDPADGVTVLQETQRTFGSSGNGNGLLESIVQKNVEAAGVDETTTTYSYDAQGRVIKTEKSSLMGTCQFTYTVYDNAGNVLGTACGLVNTTAPTTIVGLEALYDAGDATKKHTRITEHTYDEMGRRVATTVNAATSFSRTSRTIYDALSRVIRTIDNYVEQLDLSSEVVPPGGWVWNASSERWEYSDVDSTPVSHGTNNDENIISDTDYNERGLVFRHRDVLGRVTLSGYDLADRLVKTVQKASQPDYDASYATGDPQLRRYRADSSIVDGDVISEQFYDAAGNLVKSIDARDSVSYTVYDALNRPIRTVQNAKTSATIDLNVGDTGYSATNDPRSAGYAPSTAPDEDLISETVYDAMGRVLTSQRLLENRGASAVWDTTYFVYDELGRQKRVIQHYVVQGTSDPADWVYESGVWKQAPSGTAISHGNNDQNIITETVYDVSGRVKETLDVNRRVTRFVYDGLNRQVMTIANYVAQATEPENWVWRDVTGVFAWRLSDANNTLVDFGTNFDQNIISHTEYDGDGRVLETRNVEGLIQRNAYDTAGRSYLTVANYVDNSYQSPSLWVWDAGQTQWEDGNNVAIDRGTGFDQNLIAKPDYDDEGRVFQTRDSRGNLTRQVYDEAGRRVMTISNYVAQGSSDPADWEWASNEWQDGASNAIDFGTNNDQNRISHTMYDILGRVVTTRDAAGRVSRTVYDALGRRTLVLQNEVAQANPPEEWEWDTADKRWEDGSGNAIHSTDFDVNIIAQTVYNRAGQVVSTRDARGTETTFEYDGAGRRVMVTAAANTGQRARTYTCYDKAGRVLRTIQGYEPTGVDPDTWDAGTWEFAPTSNGYHHDENRITEHEYDAASRRVKTINPEGDEVETAYFLDGQVDSMTDPMGVVTVYRYDQLNRRKLVVQNYVSNGEDPALWVYDDVTDNQYEESDGTPIVHGTNKDQNIIVQVDYDIAGRMTQMRDPRGNVTSYEYDVLGRRTKLTNPLSNEWVTAYTEVSGAQRTTMTYPGLSTGGAYNVVRDFDRMGRLLQLDYNAAATTPKVNFTYDILGNRQTMVENNGTGDIRKTIYDYDAANRLIEVGFDNDGGGTVDDTVEYEYDLGGRRTKLTIVGSPDKSVTYTYDQKGRLIALTDWDGQTTSFAYDKADRHVRTRRSNGLDSLYQHDAAGRLRTLHHLKGAAELRQSFAYAVNALGNRTQAQEITPRTSGAAITTMSHTYPALVYRGDWNDIGDYHEASVHDASVSMLFYGDTATLTMGKNSDCSIFDVYIDGTLWLSFDGYAASASDLAIPISVGGTGLHLLEVKNRLEHRIGSSGYKLRFKSLYAQPAFDVTTIDYGYDGLSRLLTANYSVGADYTYGYDVAGNLVNNNGVTRTYNAANQMVDDGTNTLTYDANGNLTSDGVNSLTWDRANRMLTAPGSTSYKYDGLGNRIQQTVSSVVTDYLNDVQPGLVKLLRQDDGTNVDHFVHAVRGIHAVDDGTDWTWYTQDGLGSVRGLVDAAADVVSSQSYNPYGVPDGSYGAGFGFTGEQTDDNDLLYLRARYYAPQMGVFTALDPFEGRTCKPMSLNGYSWVEGNVPNKIDPSGMQTNETTPVPKGLGCATLFDAHGTLNETMARLNLSDPQTTLAVLAASLGSCRCELLDSWNASANPLNLQHVNDLVQLHEANIRGLIERSNNPCLWEYYASLVTHQSCNVYHRETSIQNVFTFREILWEILRHVDDFLDDCNGRVTEANSWGFKFQFSRYVKTSIGVGPGGGIALYIMKDSTERVTAVLAGSLGFGVGAGGTLAYVESEATLDEIAGFGIGIDVGAFLYHSMAIAASGECPSTVETGFTAGAGASLTASLSCTLLDTQRGYFPDCLQVFEDTEAALITFYEFLNMFSA